MVMDLCGRNPTSPAGEEIQFTILEWPAILDLLSTLCADLLGPRLLVAMRRNNGAGPVDQAVCREMAIRFGNWMEHHVDGCAVDLGVRIIKENGLIATAADEAKLSENETRTAHAISDGELKKWVSFLWECGGFAVW